MKLVLLVYFIVLYKINTFATGFPTITVTGKIVSYDSNNIILNVDGKKFSVPRSSVLKKHKMLKDETVEAEIPSPFVKNKSAK